MPLHFPILRLSVGPPMLKQFEVPDAQTLARVKAVEPAVSAIAQRDQLGLRVSNRRYEGVLRVCGAAGDWPAVNRLSQHLKVLTRRLTLPPKSLSKVSHSKPHFIADPPDPAAAPWTGVQSAGMPHDS